MGTHDTEIVVESVTEVSCTACQHPLDVSGLPSFTEIACPECGTPQVVPAKLGNFLLLGLLGKGGMGAVYRGLDTSLDRPVAVKVMLASLGADAEFVETFRREAQATAALNHPNIVQIYSFGVAHGQPYMVMELLDGGRFDQMIARGEPINEALVLKIGADVAEGLNAAAAIGLIHGDVKPENILLDTNGVAKVVDFGLARFKERGGPAVAGIWGTPYYIAPEKIRGQQTDARSDIYSLGATLFHALTAKPPFDGETPLDVIKARLKGPAPALKSIRPDINPEVEAIIARTLEVEPIKRYPNYTSLLADIRKTLATLKPPPTAVPQISKRGGKIVLTRKKGAPSARLNVAGMDSMVGRPYETAASAPAGAQRSKAKIALIVTLIVAGVLALGGGLAWGFFAYKADKERRAEQEARRQASEKESAELTLMRAAIGKSWGDMLTAISNGVRRVDRLKSVVADAEMAQTAIAQAASNLTDAALLADVTSNTPALFQALSDVAVTEAQAGLADLHGLTNAAATNLVSAQAATNIAQAQTVLTAMTNLMPLVKAGEQRITNAVAQAQATLGELLAFKKKVAEAAEQQAAEAKRIAAQKAEEAKRAREEAAAKKRAEEQAALTEQELGKLDEVRKANATLLQQCRFKDAIGALAAVETAMTTDGAKAAYKAAEERYRLMLGLKAFIIEGITKDAKASQFGFKYGWLVNNVPSLDVLGADDTKIVLRGRTVSWDQVSPDQLLRFAKRYLDNPDVSREAASRHLLATATYVYEVGGGAERPRSLAADYVGKAVARDPGIADKAKALLPDLPDGP